VQYAWAGCLRGEWLCFFAQKSKQQQLRSYIKPLGIAVMQSKVTSEEEEKHAVFDYLGVISSFFLLGSRSTAFRTQ
jgi:hypothetical protein